jgi:hypothetical protein
MQRTKKNLMLILSGLRGTETLEPRKIEELEALVRRSGRDGCDELTHDELLAVISAMAKSCVAVDPSKSNSSKAT